MKVISKFVLNRNNTEFYYVEKKQKANKMKYFVHLSPKEIIEYNDHNFHNIRILSVDRFYCKRKDKSGRIPIKQTSDASYSLFLLKSNRGHHSQLNSP